MYCKKCGREIDDNAYACPNCGALTHEESAEPGSNTKALLGFIFAFFIPLVGLILSILGLRNAPKFNGDRKGLATAGIVISIVSMVLNFFVIIVRVGAAL